MARAIYPIVKLGRPAEWAFPLDLEDLMEAEGVKVEDDFTYTTRYSVDTADTALVERLKTRIRAEVEDADTAERLIEFMAQNDWDVSFLVDCY